jgi:uncharacterized membrane protein YfbV (UPF0208 family)
MNQRETDRGHMVLKYGQIILALITFLFTVSGVFWVMGNNLAVVQNDVIAVKESIIEVKNGMKEVVPQETFKAVVQRLDDRFVSLDNKMDANAKVQDEKFEAVMSGIKELKDKK